MIDDFRHDSALAPTLEELQRSVVPRVIMPRPEEAVHHSPDTPLEPSSPHRRLSREADAFLRHAAQPGHEALTLEAHWAAFDITSGSVKKRVLDELRGLGLICLERRGKAQAVHLYKAAWDYLGLRPPKDHGRGGALHRQLADRLARHFKKHGFDIHIECEIGPRRKRVDLVAFSRGKRVGVEIALTEVEQEVRNLKEDLNAGVLDMVLIVSVMESILRRIKTQAERDPVLAPQMGQVHFHLINPEDLD